jgi:hypothetical protein
VRWVWRVSGKGNLVRYVRCYDEYDFGWNEIMYWVCYQETHEELNIRGLRVMLD